MWHGDMNYMDMKMNSLQYMNTIWKIKIDIYTCFAWVGCIEWSYIFLLDVFKKMHKIWRLESNALPSNLLLVVKMTMIL